MMELHFHTFSSEIRFHDENMKQRGNGENVILTKLSKRSRCCKVRSSHEQSDHSKSES